MTRWPLVLRNPGHDSQSKTNTTRCSADQFVVKKMEAALFRRLREYPGHHHERPHEPAVLPV